MTNLLDCALDDRNWIQAVDASNPSGALVFVVRLPALCLLHNLELVAKQNCR
jgi:hypothetical protein